MPSSLSWFTFLALRTWQISQKHLHKDRQVISCCILYRQGPFFVMSKSSCNCKTSFSLYRNKRADVRKVAHRFLVENLTPLILSYVKKKRFHQIFLEEMPWKAQMNLYLASAHFNLLLTKLGERTKIKFGSSPIMVRYSILSMNTVLVSKTWIVFVCSGLQCWW